MLFSYKMTDDVGFAPNPFHGFLSLATCKPKIRLKKDKGNYIAGFTSKELCGEKVGHERLVFIMKVTEKVNFDRYWNDPQFQIKKPNRNSKINTRGDNIYEPIKNLNKFDINNYIQHPNYFHFEREREHDLTGQFVLLSDEFFYFGMGAIPLDEFKINIPRTQSAHGVKTDDGLEIKKIWEYLSANFPKSVPINRPHKWPTEML